MKAFIVLLIFSLLLIAAECPQQFFSGNGYIYGEAEYPSSDAHLAIEMATLLATDNLAKKISTVLIEESGNIYNDSFDSIIKTHYATILAGFEVVEKNYNSSTSQAKVVLRLKRQLAREIICNTKP
ncbi:MAG: hypothetical protein JXK05_08180 [Campylobacterales bacterium]|nr:hypothetical protein [Campylobacterales bacterium]